MTAHIDRNGLIWMEEEKNGHKILTPFMLPGLVTQNDPANVTEPETAVDAFLTEFAQDGGLRIEFNACLPETILNSWKRLQEEIGDFWTSDSYYSEAPFYLDPQSAEHPRDPPDVDSLINFYMTYEKPMFDIAVSTGALDRSVLEHVISPGSLQSNLKYHYPAPYNSTHSPAVVHMAVLSKRDIDTGVIKESNNAPLKDNQERTRPNLERNKQGSPEQRTENGTRTQVNHPKVGDNKPLTMAHQNKGKAKAKDNNCDQAPAKHDEARIDGKALSNRCNFPNTEDKTESNIPHNNQNATTIDKIHDINETQSRPLGLVRVLKALLDFLPLMVLLAEPVGDIIVKRGARPYRPEYTFCDPANGQVGFYYKILLDQLLEGPAKAWVAGKRFSIVECGVTWVLMENDVKDGKRLLRVSKPAGHARAFLNATGNAQSPETSLETPQPQAAPEPQTQSEAPVPSEPQNSAQFLPSPSEFMLAAIYHEKTDPDYTKLPDAYRTLRD